jgi:hypothetical protein
MSDATAVLLRLNTAIMALHSAIAEAAQPAAERDEVLMECLLEALRHAQRAEAIVNRREKGKTP